jgi:hypothetical protein
MSAGITSSASRQPNGTAYGLSSSLCTNRLDLITERYLGRLREGTPETFEAYSLDLVDRGASDE